MGRKTKFPLRNLFYWSAFCVALSLLLISNAKASLLSDVSNAKNSNPKKSTISFSAFAKKAIFFGQSIVDTGANLGKTFTNDIKDFGATVGNSMDSVGSTFESSIKDGENSVAGLFNATQKTIKEKIGKISVKAAQPVRADQREEAALKAKTVEKKITVKEQVTASFLQTGLNKIKNISKKAVDAGADFGQTLSHDIKDFGATVGNSMDSVGSTFESSIKEGTDGVVELVDAAKSKIGQLADKINPSADEQPAVKNIAVESGVVVGPKQKTTDNGLQTTATTNKTSDTATVQTKKTTLVVTPTTISKSQLTVYSNSETKKEVAKALAPQTNNSNETKAAKTETPADETKTAADSANGITTLQDIKIIGTVDFSNAKVTGLQQTVVNNYSSGPSMTVYNEKDKKNEEWTMLSGAGGGVSHGFSVGTNLSVGKNTDSTSGDITATRNITAGGNITASGSGNFGSLTMSSIIASGNSNVSGTLQVTNTTTLYNDLLVGAAAESISDPGFIFNGNDAYFHDKIGVNGIAYFDNTLQASSTLLVGTAAGTDNLFVNGNNTYVATSTAAGTAYSLVVGNGTTGAVIAGGHVSPSHTGLFDLGRNGLGWNNLFTSSTIYTGAGGTSLSTLSPNILAFAGSTGVVSSTAGNLRLAADGANQLQMWTNGSQRAFIDSSGNTFASGTLQTTGSMLTYGNVTSTGIIYASSGLISSASSSFGSNVNVSGVLNASGTVYLGGNLLTGTGTGNSLDIGALNNAFRNVYASSSINVGASGTSSTFKGNYLALTDGTSSTVFNGSSLTLGQGTAYNSGMFNVDSNGNVSASGTVQLQRGLVSAPSYTFTGDNDTGIFSAGADSISIVTNGTLRLNANNTNVKIRDYLTNSNGASLNLYGSFAADTAGAVGLRIGNENALSASNAKIVSFYSDNATTERAYINASGTPAFGIQTGYNDGLFKIDTSGNVSATGSLKTFGNVTSTGNLYALTGTASTSILNGSSLTLGQGTAYNSGMFNVDSNGNVSASGTLQLAAGTAALPAHSFVSDPNTGFWNYAGDTIGVASAGANVGTIGTGSTLDFNTFRAFNNVVLTLSGRVTDGATAVNVQLQPVTVYTTAGAKLLSIWNGPSGNGGVEKAFVGVNGELAAGVATGYNFGKFYVDSSGNVSVTGSLKTFGNVTSTGNLYALTGTASTSILNGSSLTLGQGTNYNSGMFNVDSNGNVNASGTLNIAVGGGIGATSTFAGGAFFGGSTSNNVFVGSVPGTYPGLWFNTVVPGVTNYAILYDGATTIFNTPAAQKLAWRIGNVDTMKIDSTGQTAMIVAAGYNLGKFYVDSSGNVSASGTTLVFTNSSGVTVSSTAGNLNLSAGVAAGSKLMKFWADGTEVMRLGANPSMTDVQVGVTTNYNAGALSMNYQNGNVSTSGTLRIFGGTNLNPGGLGQNDKFGLAIASVTTAAAGTTAAASTTLTSYVVDGVGSTGFVFNTVIASTGAGMTSTTIDPPDRFLATFQNGGTNAVLITAGGSVYADDSFIANSTYYGLSDVAEYVNLADGETGEPGDVLVVDLANPNKFKKSSSAYSKEIAGVISDTGAFLMGASGKGRVPLGLAGLVRVNASDENGPIAVGDYLVSASKPGYAMKYDSSSGKSAGLVGMALEPLTAGESRIAIMVNKGLVNGGGGSTTLTINEESDGTLTNSLSLNIQNKSLLNVKAINGEDSLWYIDETGLLVAKDIKADSVQAKKFIVKKKSDAKQTSVGEATILNNSTLILVENELVTSTSKIFITFRSNPNAFWWISKQEDGKFEVSLSKLSETDLTFDYWIISTENADEEALVEDVQSVGVVETETPPTEESPSPAPIEEPAAEEPSVEATPEIVTEPETPVIEESAVEQPAEPAPTTEPAPTEPTTVPAEADL